MGPTKSAETSKFELAHSSVPKVHLEVQSPLDPSAKVKEEESECHMRNKGDVGEVAGGVKFVPDLSFKNKMSSLVYVSDFTEDSDNGHENIGETREGDDKEQGINLISNTLIGATKNDALNMTALENESLDTKLQPTDVRDEIEDFDEKVARVKAKLDLENSEEAKAVEAVMAGLKEKYSQWGHCEDGKVEDEQEVVVVGKHVQECIDINMPLTKEVKVVEANPEALGRFERGEVEAGLVDGRVDDQEEVERHVQECIENVIEQGRRNIVKALEGGSEEHIQEGGVDVGLKAKRKLRRQRWSWL